jgi:RP/EB family microtubule-associated protein
MLSNTGSNSMMGPSADSAIGMMDAAYFTSRKDILDWLNATLELNLTKIEQTASGAVACQIIEYVFPGSIPMHRVDWEAKSDYEFIQNYKLLQAAFTKHRVQRHVDVDKLIRAKYQDNLEFMQWLKAFFDQTAPRFREGYDPVATRAKGKGGKAANQIFRKNARQFGSKLLPTDRSSSHHHQHHASHKSEISTKENATHLINSSSAVTTNVRRNLSSSNSLSPRRHNASNPSSLAPISSFNTEQIIADAKLLKRNEELSNEVSELQNALLTAERDREFYLEKLRRIEVTIESSENSYKDTKWFIKRISKILFDLDESVEEINDEDAPAFAEENYQILPEEHTGKETKAIVGSESLLNNVSTNITPVERSYFSYAEEDFLLDDELLTADDDHVR